MHECTSWFFYVKSLRKMFRSKMRSLSWVFDDKWNASHSGFVNLVESSVKKSYKFDEMRFELKWKNGEVNGKWNPWTWKCFSLENFGFRKKYFLKIDLDPLWSKKMCLCSLTQATLSLSKGKWCKWGSMGQNVGFIYMHVGEGYLKSHKKIDLKL
jgi:hypothetical protein